MSFSSFKAVGAGIPSETSTNMVLQQVECLLQVSACLMGLLASGFIGILNTSEAKIPSWLGCCLVCYRRIRRTLPVLPKLACFILLLRPPLTKKQKQNCSLTCCIGTYHEPSVLHAHIPPDHLRFTPQPSTRGPGPRAVRKGPGTFANIQRRR